MAHIRQMTPSTTNSLEPSDWNFYYEYEYGSYDFDSNYNWIAEEMADQDKRAQDMTSMFASTSYLSTPSEASAAQATAPTSETGDASFLERAAKLPSAHDQATAALSLAIAPFGQPDANLSCEDAADLLRLQNKACGISDYDDVDKFSLTLFAGGGGSPHDLD